MLPLRWFFKIENREVTMDSSCGLCTESDCRGNQGYTDPDCPKHGRQKEPKSFIVTFKDKLHRSGSGYSPGGAVFPLEQVKKFDKKKNTLLLTPCMYEEKNGLHYFKFEHAMMVVHPRKISEIM